MIHPNLTGRRRARATNHAHGPRTVTITKSIAATNSSSERKLLTKARRKMRRQLAKTSADIGTSDEDINDDDSDDDDNDIEIEPDKRNSDLD
jgi:hypothetical protein